MSLKQNAPPPLGSTTLEVAQGGHAELDHKHLCLAASTPSHRKAWTGVAELPAGTRVCYIHLQASSHYRNGKKCKCNIQVMQHHQLLLKMTVGGQSSRGSPHCARAVCSPLPPAASAAPGKDRAGSHRSWQLKVLCVAAVPSLELLHRGSAPSGLSDLEEDTHRGHPCLSPTCHLPRPVKWAVISTDRAVLGKVDASYL